jgi:hypothetical protein
MKAILKHSLLILFVLAITPAFAFYVKKEKKASKRPVSFNASVKNFAIAMPPAFKNGSWHPGVEVGFNVPIKKDSKKKRLTVGANAGYFAQSNLQRSVYLQPKIEYKINVTKNLSISPNIATGLQLVRNTNSEFTFASNNTFTKNSPYRAQFLGSLGVAPEFKIGSDKRFDYSVFVNYQFAAQTPFSALSSLLPMSVASVGIRIIPKVR